MLSAHKMTDTDLEERKIDWSKINSTKKREENERKENERGGLKERVKVKKLGSQVFIPW